MSHVVCVIDDEDAYLELFKEHINIHLNYRDDIEIKKLLLDGSDEDEINWLYENLFDIDILFVDWEMPRYTGEELIKDIYNSLSYEDIVNKPKIILNTQYWEDVDKCVNSMKAGADDCVTFDKYDFIKLSQAIEKYVEEIDESRDIIEKYNKLLKDGTIF